MKWKSGLFCTQCKRVFFSPTFYLAVIFIPILFQLEYDVNRGSNVYTQISYAMWMQNFWPVATICFILPYGLSYLEEKRSGNLTFILQRAGRKKYINTKIWMVFLSGGMSALLGFCMYVGSLYLFRGCNFSIEQAECIGGYLEGWISEKQSFGYFFSLGMSQIMFGGTVAVAGLIVSMIVKNSFVSCIGVYALWYLLLIIGVHCFPQWLQYDQVVACTFECSNPFVATVYSLLFFGVIIVIEYFVVCGLFKAKKQQDKESVLRVCKETDCNIQNARRKEPFKNANSRVKKKNVVLRTGAIVIQNFRKWLGNPRIYIMFFLVFVVIWHQMQGVGEKADSMGVAINGFALFPILYGNAVPIGRIILGIGCVLLFCDAPFLDNNQRFILARAGRRCFCIAQMSYIVLGSLLYTIFVFLSQLVYVGNRIGFAKEWGTLFQTISLTDSHILGNMYISRRLITSFSVIEAFLHQVVLFFFVSIFLGLFLYLCNLMIGKKVGPVLASILVMVSRIPYFVPEMDWIYWISPVSLSELSHLDINATTKYPPLSYAYIALIGLNSLLGIMIYLYFQGVSIVGEDENG